MALQNFQLINLKNVLEKELEIPSYQREYAWDKEEYEDLWKDLEDTIDSEKTYKHFFGQIVVHSKADCLTIIDGQQRITTSFILVSAFIYSLKELYDSISDKGSNNAQLLNRKIINYENILGIITCEENYLNQKPHLKQNDADNEFFLKVITKDGSLKKKQPKKSQDRMRKACNYFYDQIKNKVKDLSLEDKKDILIEYLDCLLQRFQCMYIEATELDEAFTIFETLNARGKDLASADLLKNHLFTTGKDVDTSNAKWNKILEVLEDIDMTKFIRAYWNSKHKFIREKALYKEIASFVRNKRESKDFLDELGNACNSYHDLAKPDSPIYFQNTLLLDSLKGLRTLNASSFYPIILAMVSKKDSNFTESDIAEVASVLESYVFRNAAICGQTANSTEVYFASIAFDIYGEDLTDKDSIIEKIKDKMVGDDEFKSSFMDYDSSNKDRIRYIFRKIHTFKDVSNELNLNNSEVHIEHIMPEDISNWDNVSKEDHDEYLWKLGNLCLLSGPLNISISNKKFSEKKVEAYEISKIEPNKDVCSYSNWDKNSIIDRQQKLFEIAKKIWSK